MGIIVKCGSIWPNVYRTHNHKMPDGRDKTRMKMVGCFVTKEFKERVEDEANRREMTTADFLRELLKRELGETKNIGTQRQFRKRK